ncbi:MAG: membrane protein insertion efficiency factor YidD [Bacilli bacterium]|jgi:putative membrane protein insertion efficiency factor
MKRLLINIIKIYQIIPGPWHNYCYHIPSCSNYMIEAIEIHGVIRGSYLGFKRILRCNPWGTSGYDPVPRRRMK